jgi:hypothetical protein
MMEKRNVLVFGGEVFGKTLHGRPWHRCEDKIK